MEPSSNHQAQVATLGSWATGDGAGVVVAQCHVSLLGQCHVTRVVTVTTSESGIRIRPFYHRCLGSRIFSTLGLVEAGHLHDGNQ